MRKSVLDPALKAGPRWCSSSSILARRRRDLSGIRSGSDWESHMSDEIIRI